MSAYRQADALGAAGAIKIGGLLALVAAVALLWIWPRWKG